MIKRYLPKSTEELIHWYERYISPLSLIVGFIADNLFLTRRVDLWQTNALLSFYLVLSAAGMLFLNAVEEGKLRGRRYLAVAPFVPIVIQFAFGGLFSGYLSLYSRSAAFAGSWVFVIVVAILLVGNERFRRLYVRVPFQISLYFIVLFSFFIFYLPVLFHRIGVEMFLAGGMLSLVILAAFLVALGKVAPRRMKESLTPAARAVALIFLVFNILYFTNLIPPLPLALRSAGVYHEVARVDGQYRLSGEEVPWYESFLNYNTIFHRAPGDTAYVFTAVFAPTGLSTTVVHEWQHYDAATSSWLTVSRLSFTISGGRDGGYRAYSAKDDPATGPWRVNVLTPDGRIIAQVAFTVVDATSTPELVEKLE